MSLGAQVQNLVPSCASLKLFAFGKLRPPSSLTVFYTSTVQVRFVNIIGAYPGGPKVDESLSGFEYPSVIVVYRGVSS